MILRLDPPVWLHIPKGEAMAHFLIDRGADYDLEWVCFQQDTGECWAWICQEDLTLTSAPCFKCVAAIPART